MTRRSKTLLQQAKYYEVHDEMEMMDLIWEAWVNGNYSTFKSYYRSLNMESRRRFIGFVHRHVVKMSYIYGSNVVRFEVLDHPLSSDIKSRISQWLEIVRTGVNENSLDANTKLSTIPLYFNDIRSGNIIFEYNTVEK